MTMVVTQLYFLALVAVAQAILPNIVLPWGVWNASTYNEDSDVYVFKNVRFGAKPPRFGRSAFPTQWDSNHSAAACYQVSASGLQDPRNPEDGPPDFSAPPRDLLQDEDCLFVDVYAPASNFDDSGNPLKNLPVVVWLYGGAYAFGSKQLGENISLYTGQSMIEASGENVIFVAGNYRLGAFGWLAGSYMEDAGQPNAGLYDQALLFEWTQRYISQAGGNPNQISAWGESAGAGSILHHLVRRGGTVKPAFNTFMVQSPAFPWSWNNSAGGTLDQVYLNFSEKAGCGRRYDIDCLRKTNINNLIQANLQLYADVKRTGIYPVGPSVDGDWVQTIPVLSFGRKQYYQSISGAIISHVYNESYGFTPAVRSQADVDAFLVNYLPGTALAGVRTLIRSRYNCTVFPYYSDFRLCLAAVIGDGAFYGNARVLRESYPGVSWALQYAFPTQATAVHASDLLPAFMNGIEDAVAIILNANPEFPKDDAYILAGDLDFTVKSTYQAYLAGFAAKGDPNAGGNSLKWPIAQADGAALRNVLRVQQYIPFEQSAFVLTTDTQQNTTVLGFWADIALKIEQALEAEKAAGGPGSKDDGILQKLLGGKGTEGSDRGEL